LLRAIPALGLLYNALPFRVPVVYRESGPLCSLVFGLPTRRVGERADGPIDRSGGEAAGLVRRRPR